MSNEQEIIEMIKEFRDQHYKHKRNAETEHEERFHDYSAGALQSALLRIDNETDVEVWEWEIKYVQ